MQEENENVNQEVENTIPVDADNEKIEVIIEEAKKADPNADDEEYGEYGPKVKKRIDRLTKKFRDEQRNRRKLEEELVAERAQREEAQRVVAMSTYNTVQQQETHLNQVETQAEAQYQRARETGNVAEERAAFKLMAQIAARREQVLQYKQQHAANFPQFDPRQPQQQQQRQPEYARPQQAQPLAEEAQNWIDQNEWFDQTSPNYDRRKAISAARIAARLEQEGYSASDPDHYTELNRELERQFSTQRASSPVSGPSRGTATSKKLKLDAASAAYADRKGIPHAVMAREMAKHYGK